MKIYLREPALSEAQAAIPELRFAGPESAFAGHRFVIILPHTGKKAGNSLKLPNFAQIG